MKSPTPDRNGGGVEMTEEKQVMAISEYDRGFASGTKWAKGALFEEMKNAAYAPEDANAATLFSSIYPDGLIDDDLSEVTAEVFWNRISETMPGVDFLDGFVVAVCDAMLAVGKRARHLDQARPRHRREH